MVDGQQQLLLLLLPSPCAAVAASPPTFAENDVYASLQHPAALAVAVAAFVAVAFAASAVAAVSSAISVAVAAPPLVRPVAVAVKDHRVVVVVAAAPGPAGPPPPPAVGWAGFPSTIASASRCSAAGVPAPFPCPGGSAVPLWWFSIPGRPRSVPRPPSAAFAAARVPAPPAGPAWLQTGPA